MIAALYVDPKGPYPKIAGVECWDEERDAKLYPGPGPVIAHPPCGPWGRYRTIGNCKQDPECARVAVTQVRTWGGVLEHPAESALWVDQRLPRPGQFRDSFGGWTLEVEQVRWGHRAQKRTWFYIVGCGMEDLPVPPPFAKASTTVERLSRLSRLSRRLTPPAMALWLVYVAQKCRK